MADLVRPPSTRRGRPRRKPLARPIRRAPKTETRGNSTITTYDGGIRGWTADVSRLPPKVLDTFAYRLDQRAHRYATNDKMPFREMGEGPGIRLVNASYRNDSAYITVVGTPAGPWIWLEDGVKRHGVTAGNWPGPWTRRKKFRTQRRRADRNAVRAFASFPRKRTWSRTLDAGRRMLDREMDRNLVNAMK